MWTLYQLIFRLKAPIHSGYIKTGNINRTRLYITGRMMWGALTARITRLRNSSDYENTGKLVKKYLRTSYFYPAFYNDDYIDSLTLIAKKDTEIIETIERAILTSYASTAINYNHWAAEEGSLHEIELISATTIHELNVNNIIIEKGSPVFLKGYIFVNNDAPEEIASYWRDALNKIQVGGERTYGFGQVFLEIEPQEVPNIFDYSTFLNKDEPIIEIPEAKIIPAHILSKNVCCDGIVEPFMGRYTGSAGDFGRQLSHAEICWTPNSIIRDTKISSLFRINEFGILESTP
jgi:hypothetical protein